MSNHMMMSPAQRNANGHGAPNGAMDVWSQGPGNHQQLSFPSPHAAHAAHGPSPVEMVQRLLRGRVLLAIVLAGIGSIIGGVLGYMSQAPTYRATGLIQINPTIPLVDGDKAIPYYQNFMTSQALIIASPTVINEVPKFEPWKSVVGKNEGLLNDLSANLKCSFVKGSFNIGIEYSNPNPKIASAAVYSAIQAYKAIYKDNSGSVLASKLQELEDRAKAVRDTKEAAEKRIDDITAKYGSADLTSLVKSAENKKSDIDRDLTGNRSNYRAAKDAIDVSHKGGAPIPTEELAQIDPRLGQMQSDYEEAVVKEAYMEKNYGKRNPQVVQLMQNIEIMQNSIEAYADTIRKNTLAIIPDFVKGGFMRVTPGNMAVLEMRVRTLSDDFDLAEKDRATVAADAGKIASDQTIIRNAAEKLQKMDDSLTTMHYSVAMTGELQVMQDGSFASKAQDKKIMFGFVGAVGGALIPVALLMALGLLDTRFRHSDDAAGSSMSGIPLLGILPNLPDRLSDPAQASIAAHCVHQIRTMLQLNSMREEESTVFAVTSASSGDGKTSLSLALGLSFAASGSRTLLIDADLVGGGLTSRLGNSAPRGIIDALGGASLDDCVQPTDVSDLSLLPLGAAQAHHAGSFSPPAVRRLLMEVRKHYEVIIVDTGPIMGSIEATPIAASVDGVVLTVARGQSRPLVERAIAHLKSVGAHVSGVVFNRAQHRDFEQSIGAISIRSAARSTASGTGHNARRAPGDYGAVATAVASSVRQDG